MLSSVRKGLLITTACITCVTSLSAFIIYAWFSFHQQQRQLESRVTDQAQALAINVAQQIAQHGETWQDDFPALINYSDFVVNAHVYTYTSDGNLNFLTSYNRPGVAPIASREDAFTDLRLGSQGIDIMFPFFAPQSVFANTEIRPQGYVFIRADAQPLRDTLQFHTVVAFFVIVLAILLSLFLAAVLSRFFTRPLHEMIDVTAQVARTRDYHLRVPHSPFAELDMLGRNFNTVLERIEQFIRQQKKAEAATAQMTAELEQQVQERTTALRNANQELLETLEQLHQHQGRQVEAQKMSSLSELVAGISHEINTPLGMAVTAASMIDNSIQQLPESHQVKLAQQLAIVQRNLTRSVELINNFKKLAIEHAGEEASAVEFGQMLDDIVTSARTYVEGGKHVDVQIQCDLKKPILAKVGIWHQLILSLFENSVLHGFASMETGRVELIVSEQDDQLQFIYRDNGAGVPADILRRIFDPFVTSKRGKGNSGLGMHLVYNLVTHTLDGTISCHSVPEEGFEVIIQCPFDEAK